MTSAPPPAGTLAHGGKTCRIVDVRARDPALAPRDRSGTGAPAGALAPRCRLPARVPRRGGSAVAIDAIAVVETALGVELSRAGGAIPAPLLQASAAARGRAPAHAS
jgi:hypothetical protein